MNSEKIKKLLNDQVDRVRIVAYRSNGTRTSVLISRSLARAVHGWAWERGVALRDLTMFIDSVRPDLMTLSEAVKTVYAYIANHKDEAL